VRKVCPLADDGDQDINGYGNPYLDPDGILGGAVEGFDAEMLLDPLEEEFHLPPGLVQAGDSQGGLDEVVGDEHEILSCHRIAVTDPAQGVWIMTMRNKTGERDRLVETDAGGLVGRVRIAPAEPGVLLCPCDEECAAPVQAMQSAVIQIGLVHDVEGSGIEAQLVQNVHVVDAARRDDNHGREVASQRQERVELDCSLGAAERRPRKQGETKVDGRRVQRVSRLRQFHAEVLSRIEVCGLRYQDVREVGEDAPVALLVGVRQRAAGCAGPYSAVIQLRAERPQTSLDVPKALPVRELGKRKNHELLVAAHGPDMKVAPVPFDTLRQLVLRQPVHKLGKNGPSLVHDSTLPSLVEGEGWRKRL